MVYRTRLHGRAGTLKTTVQLVRRLTRKQYYVSTSNGSADGPNRKRPICAIRRQQTNAAPSPGQDGVFANCCSRRRRLRTVVMAFFTVCSLDRNLRRVSRQFNFQLNRKCDVYSVQNIEWKIHNELYAHLAITSCFRVVSSNVGGSAYDTRKIIADTNIALKNNCLTMTLDSRARVCVCSKIIIMCATRTTCMYARSKWSD